MIDLREPFVSPVTLKAVATMAAIRAGLLTEKKDGVLDVMPFERFWEEFVPLMRNEFERELKTRDVSMSSVPILAVCVTTALAVFQTITLTKRLKQILRRL